jgi:hypothetical protein
MYASYTNSIYTMNLEMAPIASKIGTNQQIWQDKYGITSPHKDLHGNPLQEKTTSDDVKQSTVKMKIREVGDNKVGEGSKSPPISLSNGWIW